MSSAGNNIEISIIILSKNGAGFIAQLLNNVYNQKIGKNYEVIVIDSGSTDSTLNSLKNYPLRLIEIKPEEFGHGKTRNLGAYLAQGEILVFLNGDAIPKDNLWLANLIMSVHKSDDIAGSYSKVLPREDCNPLRQREILNDPTYDFNVTEIKYIKDHSLYNNMPYAQRRILLAFETISCAIKRTFLQRFPFRDDIEFGEDFEWSKRIIEAGFKISFEPSSQVIHSHDFYCFLPHTVKKFFDDAKLNKDLLGYSIDITPSGFLSFISTRIANDVKYISGLNKGILYKAKWILFCPLVRISQFIGVTLGCYSRKVPSKFHRKISLVSEIKNL